MDNSLFLSMPRSNGCQTLAHTVFLLVPIVRNIHCLEMAGIDKFVHLLVAVHEYQQYMNAGFLEIHNQKEQHSY